MGWGKKRKWADDDGFCALHCNLESNASMSSGHLAFLYVAIYYIRMQRTGHIKKKKQDGQQPANETRKRIRPICRRQPPTDAQIDLRLYSTKRTSESVRLPSLSLLIFVYRYIIQCILCVCVWIGREAATPTPSARSKTERESILLQRLMTSDDIRDKFNRVSAGFPRKVEAKFRMANVSRRSRN